ncbi:PPE domain-containing protein [Nocardia harenae]|uniref:PPE domain-containing protein n=1 Tax=Nocardia harenae TaxID=358707 RepID=UPI00082EE154|nr:PPE domain-containing protein [Nocardia harenae]
MIEPPQPGFTGVVWEARPPQRLAEELATGPGSVPMAEAAHAWTRLAGAFGAAVLEYEHALEELRGAWQSGRSGEVMETITTLRQWLIEVAGAAAGNAARMQAQVAAYEIAMIAMPNQVDIEAIQQAQRAVESIGTALGGPIKAVAAQTDTEADQAKAVASRVMRSYEAATEPLALAWEQQHPPRIAPEQPLQAEQSVNAASTAPGVGTRVAAASVAMPAIPMTGIPAMPVRELGGYRAPMVAQAATAAVEPVPRATPVPASPAGQSMPMAPLAQGAAAQEASRFPRAALPGETDDHLGAEVGIQAAPAVLGAVTPGGYQAEGGRRAEGLP